jgi:hypothetical protein
MSKELVEGPLYREVGTIRVVIEEEKEEKTKLREF